MSGLEWAVMQDNLEHGVLPVSMDSSPSEHARVPLHTGLVRTETHFDNPWSLAFVSYGSRVYLDSACWLVDGEVFW